MGPELSLGLGIGLCLGLSMGLCLGIGLGLPKTGIQVVNKMNHFQRFWCGSVSWSMSRSGYWSRSISGPWFRSRSGSGSWYGSWSTQNGNTGSI
jgi:hypothetical protein